MKPRSDEALVGIRDVLLETYAVNNAMNQLLLAHLNPQACRAPGVKRNDDQTIAAIFGHLHNSRLVWLKNSAPHLKYATPLGPYRRTMKQAATAHGKSAGSVSASSPMLYPPNRSAKSRSSRADAGHEHSPTGELCSPACFRMRPTPHYARAPMRRSSAPSSVRQLAMEQTLEGARLQLASALSVSDRLGVSENWTSTLTE
jgi:hypothetical protein